MRFDLEKCAHLEQISAHAARFSAAIFGKYGPRTDYRSGTGIGKQYCFCEKQAVHLSWLQGEAVWW